MTMEYITEFINKKLKENDEFIRYSFFELSANPALSKEDVSTILEVSKTYFINTGYNVFVTGQSYEYNGLIKKVESNELLIAIKIHKKANNQIGRKKRFSLF